MTDLIGHTIGQYQIIERIGKGGMADVYKAYQPGLDRYVAIKILPEYFLRDETFLARFQREAKAIAKLSHSHILPVYDFGQQDNLTYIVMQYVEAGTLKNMLGQPLDLKLTADIIEQVADALDYAHEQGIIHRDVKPSNVLMERGKRALLTDFGLARMAETTTKITKTGVGVGTPEYMSPEQGQGKEVGVRSDVYSLGVMLYEMLTGRVPYEAETPIAVVVKHLTAPLPLPRNINPAIPEAVERVVLKAMAKAPTDRYQSVREMAEALRRAVAAMPAEVVEKPVEAAPLPEPEIAPLPLVEPVAVVEVEEEAVPIWRRVPLWAWGAVGGVVLLIVVGGVLLVGRGPGATPTPAAVAGRATAPAAAVLSTAIPVPPTVYPTYTPYPTYTSVPTDTPEPTPTDTPPPPTPTNTPLPPTPTATPTLTDTPVPPTPTLSPTPEGGRIAFESKRDGNFEIYVMYADGSGVTRLTNKPAVDWAPSWSPDGRRIAFDSKRDGNDEIYVMNADGSGQTNLTNNPAKDWDPSWSPDGTRIAFKRSDEIYVMNADGSGQTNLTNSSDTDFDPSWSPDGTRIAFTSYRDIYVMNADGSGVSRLTNGPATNYMSSWSPDGGRIAFVSYRDDPDPQNCGKDGKPKCNFEIYAMNADGSGMTRLTDNPAWDMSPSWSPDGKRIAFQSDRDGNTEIYVMNADGSGVTRLTNNPAWDSSPSWGP